MKRSLLTVLGGAVLGCMLVAGCDSGAAPAPQRMASSRGPSTGSAARTSPAAAGPTSRTSSPNQTSQTRPPSASDPATLAAHRGRHLLGSMRIVAYYGAAGTGALGVLGATAPDQAAIAVTKRAQGFAGYGLPVQPAMELLATVAQRSPGADGTYSKAVAQSTIRQYLAVAHRRHLLLILDLQPGRASFLAQAQQLRPLLLDPSVHLALDPEWKVGPGGRPGGGLIGSSSAAGINAVGSWLSALVTAQHLPDKLLVVHEFTESMLPDRQLITQHPGVEMVLHADGFGHPSTKIAVLRRLAFPHPPFGVGFKLFLTQDSRLMSPAEVMKLSPRPDVITYQ